MKHNRIRELLLHLPLKGNGLYNLKLYATNNTIETFHISDDAVTGAVANGYRLKAYLYLDINLIKSVDFLHLVPPQSVVDLSENPLPEVLDIGAGTDLNTLIVKSSLGTKINRFRLHSPVYIFNFNNYGTLPTGRVLPVRVVPDASIAEMVNKFNGDGEGDGHRDSYGDG